MASLRDFLTTLKRNTLDKTDLDEKFVGGFNSVSKSFQQNLSAPKTNIGTNIRTEPIIPQQFTQPIRNYFNPDMAGKKTSGNFLPNFWDTRAANLLGQAQQNIQQGLPRVNLQQFTNNIQAPVPRTVANFGAAIGEDVINLPQRLLEGGNRLGTEIRTGGIRDPRRAIGAYASVVEPLFDVATLGAGTPFKQVLKQGVKQVGKEGLKKTLTRGAVTGAGYGSVFGGLRGLSEGEEADPLKGLQGALLGGALGGVLGGGTAGVGKAFGRVLEAIRKTSPGISDKEAQKRAVIYLRDTAGRFTGLKNNETFETVRGTSKPGNIKITNWQDAVNRELGVDPNYRIPAGLQIRDVSKEPFSAKVGGGKKQLKDLIEDEGLQVGETVKWNGDKSGRIDKVIAIEKDPVGRQVYVTQEINPPKGQKPRMGRQFYDRYGEFSDRGVGIIKAKSPQPLAEEAGDSITLYRAAPDFPSDKFKKGTYFADDPQKARYYSESHYAGDPSDIKVEQFTVPKSSVHREPSTGNYYTLEDGVPVSRVAQQQVGGGKNPLAEEAKVIEKRIDDILKVARKRMEKVDDMNLRLKPSEIDYLYQDERALLEKLKSQLPKISQKEAAERIMLKRKAQPLEGVGGAKLSTKAKIEGITEPKMGSHIAVPTQVYQRMKARGELPETPQTGMQSPNPVMSRQQIDGGLSSTTKSQGATRGELLQTRLQKDFQAGNQKIPSSGTFNDIVNKSDIKVKDKVNIIDYLRTPDRVFAKVGLKKEVELLRKKEDDYLAELPKQIDKITEWSKRADSKDSSRAIFQYLDGQRVKLSDNDLKIAKEIQGYLKDWANRLKLPEDKRVTNYITHIFEKDFIEKEFDPEIAKLIRDRAPGSVYDPFVEQRLGKMGYVEDTWRALDAYVKRATRKVHMDEALEEIAKKADQLEDSQFKYVKGRLERINMRPTWIDNMLDNTIKSVVGYRFGQRPVASLSRSARQMVYRATLGLNPGTALKNLTQGANTYAKLGEKYTVIGYSKLLKNFNSDELERVGVLKKDFIQDRTLSASHKFWERADKGLFFFFELAEKINRGAAYYGGKSKALANGATEEQAIEAGKKLVRDTQFTFGAVDTPAVLSSDLGKTVGQFQSFTLKQGEFLGEMIKNKDVAGMLRWAGASLGMVYTMGELIGMEPTDLIPSLRIGVPPTLQLPTEIGSAIMNQPDKYGQDRDIFDKAGDVGNAALLFMPGSTQFKKTFEGIRDVQRGYSTNDYGVRGIINTLTGNEGKVRFPVNQNPSNFIRGALFGTNNLPEANEYFDKERKPLSEDQSSLFKQATDKAGTYLKIISKREQENAEDELVANLKVGQETSGVINKKYIWLDDKGEKASLDLSKYDTKATGFEKAQLEAEKLSDARTAYKSNLTDDQKAEVYKTLGVKEEDVEYDVQANYETATKVNYYTERSGQISHDELLNELLEGRRQSVSGSYLANEGTLTELRDAGIISHEEWKVLKDTKIDNTGKVIGKSSGSSKKGIGASETGTTPKLSLAAITAPKIALSGGTSPSIKAMPKIRLPKTQGSGKFPKPEEIIQKYRLRQPQVQKLTVKYR